MSYLLIASTWVACAAGCGGSKPGGGGGSLVGLDGGPLANDTGGALGNGGAPGGGGGGTGGSATAPDSGSLPACGGPGLPCCEGNGCTAGGCCVAGICMAAGGSCVGLGGGICANGVCGSCGGIGFPCCGTNPAAGACTAPNTACNNGSCTTCGEIGSLCCGAAGSDVGTCSGANAICGSGNICLTCGTPGTPCCPGNQCASPGCCYNNVCTGEGAACGTSGVCQAGRCSGCGNANQPCCGSVCYGALLCKSGSCLPCGAAGEICCPTSGGTPACQSGATCAGDGVCARCGNAGDVCCLGNTCNGGCCQGGRCLAPSACPAPPDGGAPDAPLGGTGGGGGGAGGSAGTGGVTGTGGTITPWTAPAGCGDGVVTPPERCDDGNALPFDGCSSDCQPEPRCAGAGPCTSPCGDGIVVGEECDDGNTVSGDGCSTACKVESGFACAQPPLGDHILVPAVYRDFKFGKPTDFEAGVTGAEKAATGMVATTLDAEGKPVYANPSTPPGNVHVASAATFATWYRNTEGVNHATASKMVLWDNHNGAYVNRYGANGEQWPLTETALWCGSPSTAVLDADGKPIPCTYKYSVSLGGTGQNDCEDLAAEGLEMLRCELAGTGPYQGIFLVGRVDGTPLFFPVDDDPFSPSSEKYSAMIPSVPEGMYDTSSSWPEEVMVTGKDARHNFSFTSEIRYWFTYDAGQTYTLDIVGDDDVWVFINRTLAVDLGGIHTPVAGRVTLNESTAATFGLESGKVYEVAVFQAERQTESSTFKLTLAGFSLAPSVCSPR